MLLRYAFSIQDVKVDDTFHALEQIISKKRYAKMQRFHFEVDKIRSLFAEVLVRFTLKKHFHIEGADIEFEVNEFGKPNLKGFPDIQFNVSHSGNWVICAVSESTVGVDVEEIKEKNLDIAERFYAKEEYESLVASTDKNELFIRYWTLKESYVKAEGKGMSIPFSSFSFDVSGEDIKLQVEGQPCNTYHFQVYKIGESFEAATCSKEKIEGEFIKVTLEEIKKTLLS